MISRRLFSTLKCLRNEATQGIARSGTPPRLARMQRGLPQKRAIKDVNKVIAVSSAKGGVGKSTIAVNLALAFAKRGLRAGILDTDIFGPSIPTLMNLSGEPRLTEGNKLLPLTNYGVKAMSMEFLVGKDSHVAWRGPMLQKALQDLLHNVEWGGLDVLVLDLPPGTGDVQLTIAQQIILNGAVIVSTPQSLSLIDSVKGINMFKQMQVPILGMVQNMSLFQCSKCGHEEHIFGHDGVKRTCKEWDVNFLGDVPLHPLINDSSDHGKPTVVAEPNSSRSKAFEDISTEVAKLIDL
ncbi:P-loop containing nucleoside triphosphate hydrolase protein [Microthyrium microscopicum]|uniref:P-loop containing nucleoside triphosphate hydrolase protein n=1 Tax=Microthyrium microscopicum TaxID=703497 RepID=A0A6A6UCQ9_9PEZI|nr:P-loop containing nucleoside triphosphate hydrolase protein [Microthyrium microscopicum]